MDRKEFCDLLVKTRKESGVKVKDICDILNVEPTTIYRLESGSNSCGLDFVLKYITTIKSAIVLKSKVIKHYNDIVKYIQISRKNKYSQRELANLVDISYVHLANIESKKSVIGVDIFLKMLSIFGDQIKLQLPPPHVSQFSLYNSIFETDCKHCAIINVKNFFKNLIETTGWYKKDSFMYPQKAQHLKNKFHQNKLGLEEISKILDNLGYIPSIKITSPDEGAYFSDYATAYEILSKIYNINKTLGIDSLEAHKIKDGNEKRLRIDVILQFLIKIGCDIDIKWELPKLVEI